ncbi:MAG: type III-B CRISPR-associated protein Cas10/Cmr2 [Candidatus Contendobacter sp.]|nr:type III-B CRISPR-associated protein Cas10/Cmr2 [Candidatus Contendobacter sp.]
MNHELKVDGARFYHPNPGVLYPALYELLDRMQAAAKAIRPFTQLEQTGYRCSLCGEREWLTTDRDQLALPPGERQEHKTLWAIVAKNKRSWARKGEHLCAPCALKRLWPSLFVSEIEDLLDQDMRRYVVSTHTMALATTLERWLDQPDRRPLPDTLSGQLVRLRDTAALPRRLAIRLHREDRDADLLAHKLPVYLDGLRDNFSNVDSREQEQAEQALASAETDIKAVFGVKPEAYYALIMLDGDKMGAWLSSDEDYSLAYQDTWHPQIRAAIAGKFQQADLQSYAKAKRPVSPARHIAISSALNSFALHLAPYIVETVCKGKLIYAGGDDVLAMVSVDDLLPALALLRLAYSGVFPTGQAANHAWHLLGVDDSRLRRIGNGHIELRNRLYRVMGSKATASAGAVIAHHSAPLGAVLRQLRDAEKQAKNRGGRDAFTIRVLKRSGGMVELVSRWFGDLDPTQGLEGTPIGLLLRLREMLANPQLSRRVAYLAQSWLPQLPPPGEFSDPALYAKLLADNLAYQFARQCQGDDKQRATDLGRGLGKLAVALAGSSSKPEEDKSTATDLIRDFLAVAEFLAREGRVDTGKEHRHD